MADEGLIDSAPGRAFHKMGGLPKVTVLRIVDVDDGQVVAVPERWEAEGIPMPKLRRRTRRRSALGVGDRILARVEERGSGHIAHPMKKPARSEELMLGVIAMEGGRHWLKPVDKRDRKDTLISELGGAQAGDLVLAEKSGRPPRITARVQEVLGDPFAPRAFSLIAIHKYEIPNVFQLSCSQKQKRWRNGPSATARTCAICRLSRSTRPDARDQDDAVWAAPAEGGGFGKPSSRLQTCPSCPTRIADRQGSAQAGEQRLLSRSGGSNAS